jgi:hypothetical protein
MFRMGEADIKKYYVVRLNKTIPKFYSFDFFIGEVISEYI